MKKMFILMIFVCVCIATIMANNVSINAGNKCEVKFMFDGLQAIAFGNPDRATDGILDVHHHTPKFEIKQIEKGKEKVIATFEGKDLYKKVINISTSNASHKPTRYYSTDMTKDTKDFRWCLDIENDLFQKQLYLKEDKFYTKINFNVGEFVTENITEDKYQFVAGSKIHSLKRKIGFPSANVELQPKGLLVINGLGKDITLAYQNNASYQVSITNLPSKDMMTIDHFAFYYDIFNINVPKFMPTVIEKASFMPKPFLCGTMVFGKSRID